MAYSTGSSSGPNDLLDKFRAFLSANGWTINNFSTVGSGYRLHANKGSVYVNFRSYQGESISSVNFLNGSAGYVEDWGIAGYASTGYSGSQTWNTQPGYPFYSSYCQGGYMVELSGGTPAYHFFSYPDSDEVYMVAEFIAGRFQMLSFGTIEKYTPSAFGGQWLSMPGKWPVLTSSVQYIYGMDSSSAGSLIPFRSSDYNGNNGACSSMIRVNIDGHNGWAFEGKAQNDSVSPVACATQGAWDTNLVMATVSPYNWQTQLLPYALLISRDSAAAYSPFGEIRNLRRLDIRNYLPGEEFALGADTWKTFPLYQKNGYSFTRGYALKKVT